MKLSQQNKNERTSNQTKGIGGTFNENHLRMAKDAVPVYTSDVIHQHGHKSAPEPFPILENSNDGGFLAQISGNPFFTAVNMLYLRGSDLRNADRISRD